MNEKGFQKILKKFDKVKNQALAMIAFVPFIYFLLLHCMTIADGRMES